MKLTKANGYLPYHDKTSAEEIYREFGMSKKTFKMTLGSLYRKRKIALLADGIKLA
jgi:predicted RNA-binding protein (virulence factor B family)